MARLTYVLLCHQNPEAVIRQAGLLTSQGDTLAIHVDARSDAAIFDAIRLALKDNPNVTFARRVKCGWGDWSLVQATLNALEAALLAFQFTTHFYLVSGDCMPIKPAAYIHRILDENDADFIDHNDFFTSYWIKTGMREERVTYRHWFNERRNKRAFYLSLRAQQAIRLNRNPPAGMQLMIGSQWWCLRRSTIETLLHFVRKRRDVIRFFRTTWIPDEIFFQTLVPHLISRKQIQSRVMTFLIFSDYGMPVTFHSDHFELLKSQPHLFARKISAHAGVMRQKLSALFAEPNDQSGHGANALALYKQAAELGRSASRYAPRIWETGGSVGPERLLQVILCKKWQVALYIAQALADAGGPRCYGYVFEGDHPVLPPMGGYENLRSKRLQHRRAFLNVLATQENTNSLALCIDPSNIAALSDLAGDSCLLHVLEITTQYDDSWLISHADRIGLGGSALPPPAQSELAASLRQTMARESAALRRLNLPAMFRIKQGDDPREMAEMLAGFSGIRPERARIIARDPELFEPENSIALPL